MNTEVFEELLEKIRLYISEQNTVTRKAIPAQVKLATLNNCVLRNYEIATKLLRNLKNLLTL